MALRRRFDPPVKRRNFVPSVDYIRSLETAEGAIMMIVSGQNGVGKTWIAEQVFANISRRQGQDWSQEPGIYRKFKCVTTDILEDEVEEFLDEYGIVLPEQDGQPWHILIHMMRKLNEMYPELRKVFIFDDTDAPDKLLDVLDEICKELSANEAIAGKWKLIVTTTRPHGLNNIIPRNYEFIGPDNFVLLDGFTLKDAEELYCSISGKDSEEVDKEIVSSIYNKLGKLPLALSVVMGDFASLSQLEDPKEFLDKYMKFLEEEAKLMAQGNPAIDESKSKVLAACKLSIKHAISDSPNQLFCRMLITMLTFFNASNIPAELLKACAETLIPDQPTSAGDFARLILGKLIQRGLCIKGGSASEPLFTIHTLIREAMKTFFDATTEEGDLERYTLLKNALVALTRVMPRDGCSRNPRLIAHYSAHGQTMDEAVDKELATQDLGGSHGPIMSLIMLLHCDLLACIGYCLVAQQNHDAGVTYFEKALSKYCVLVRGSPYDQLSKSTKSELEALEVLYDSGQVADIVCSDIYVKFIEQVPKFHVLTHTSLANMAGVTEDDLIHRHLNERAFAKLARDGKVLVVEKLAKVYIGELLGHIQFAWSKIHLQRGNDTESPTLYIQHAHPAQKVYDLILKNHKVYLLKSLITRRNLLRYELHGAKTCADAERLLDEWRDLERAGNADLIEDRAFECGLLKSIVHEDKYHRLRCKEGQLLSLGLLYKYSSPQDSSRDDRFSQGVELLKQVTELINGEQESSYNHRDMSMAYKIFAQFMSHCSHHESAVKYVIHAMEELRRSGPNSLDPLHMAFGNLYKDLESYYKTPSPNTWLLTVEEPEATYLTDIIAAIKPPTSNQVSLEIENRHVDFLERIYSESVQPVVQLEPEPEE